MSFKSGFEKKAFWADVAKAVGSNITKIPAKIMTSTAIGAAGSVAKQAFNAGKQSVGVMDVR